MPSSRARLGSTPGRDDAFDDVHQAFDERGRLSLRVGSSTPSVAITRLDDAPACVAGVGEHFDAARFAQDLGDRTEHVRIAVGHALADQGTGAELLAWRDRAISLREPALADARVAEEQHELRAAAARA